MSQDTNVKELVINQLTKEQYNKLKKENKLSKTELYIITDDEHYTNEEIVNLLKTKQNVLVAGDNIVISDNIISADLKRYAKTIDTLYGCRRAFYDKPINLRERLDLNIQDSVDRSCPTNYIKINGDLYHINVKTNAFTIISPPITNKEWMKFTGGYYYSQYESNNVILLDQDGWLYVSGATDWYKGLSFKDICGEVNTEYKELGLGISKHENKLYSIYKENNEIVCNKISDINTWTKITGFVQNFPSYGYVTNAYGIADGKLYEIRCNTNLECEAVLIDEESGWTNISGSSGRGEFFSCIGIKNGKIYIINNGIIKLVNLDEDCSNAILCQQCGQKAYFINNKKLYVIYDITSGDNVFTPVYFFNNKEVYSYDLYYNDWISSSIYHISNTDDSNYRYLYEGENVVDETSTLNNIDKLYNFSNANFNVAFVAKKLYYTKNDTDEQYKKLVAKIDYNKDKLYIYNYYNEEIAQVDIKISTDNTTVNYNDNNELQSIGEITKNGLVKHTWIGTQEEYENDLQSGIIDETTEVLINDSVAEVITPQVEFNAPTKLSELANDMNFVDNTNLNNKVNDLNTKINSKANDIDVVHVTGNEDIDGNKTFLSEINIKTGNEYTKIGHKNSTSNTPNLQDGYIKFGKNTLKFGEQNVQGEAHNTEKDIFHSGNLVAGQNVTITQEDNRYKINGIDVNFDNYYTKNETYDSETIESLLDTKQDVLTVGEGIKLENNTISSTVQGLPIGTIIPVNATSNYVPNGSILCDGAEYTKEQFTDLWNNYLNGFDKSIYNISGGVNINNKGIANNFTQDTQISTKEAFTLTSTSTYSVKIRFKYSLDNILDKHNIIKYGYFNGLMLEKNDPNSDIYVARYYVPESKSSSGNLTVSLNTFENNEWLTAEYTVNFSTKKQTLTISNDNGVSKSVENMSLNVTDYTIYSNLIGHIGKENTFGSYFNSDIDLSSVLIKVDNTTVFDGNKFSTNYSLLPTCTYTEYTSDLSTYGQCAKFAIDTVNNKFRVPLIKDGAVIQQALTDSELGKSYNAGLPNITAGINIHAPTDEPFGAFYEGDQIKRLGGTQDQKSYRTAFNASRSNQIYGNSDTVQPNAVALRYFVVVANGQINQSMMDWSAWASSLQGKANTNLSNLTPTGKKVIDGQWVIRTSPAILNTSIANGTYNLDLSTYLPNDNYNYELLMFDYCSRNDKSGTNTVVLIWNEDIGQNVSSADTDKNTFFSHIECDGTNFQQANNSYIAYVTSTRILKKSIFGANAKISNTGLIGYRRIGTNE